MKNNKLDTISNLFEGKEIRSIWDSDKGDYYKSWSGMKANEYKEYKNIRKESLRDNMTDMEIALTDLGEIATRELAKEHSLRPNIYIEKRQNFNNLVKFCRFLLFGGDSQ